MMTTQQAKAIVGTFPNVDYFEMLKENKMLKSTQNSILGETKEDATRRVATSILLNEYTPTQWGVRSYV